VFSLEFVGDEYTLKSQNTQVEVVEGLNGAEIIEEPVEQAWYIELQSRCDYVLNRANDAAGTAEQAAQRATEAKNDAVAAQNAAEEAGTAAAASEAAAAESEENSIAAANRANATFSVVGNVTPSLNPDNSVTLTFTKEE